MDALFICVQRVENPLRRILKDAKEKNIVNLTDSEREEIQQLFRSGKHSTRKATRARILLKAADGSTDEEIAAALGVGRTTVERTRENFVERNLEALNERPRPSQKPKLDTKAKARLIAEACSKTLEGQTHWTMQLLADRLVELKIVETISDETVRPALKKNDLKP